MEDDKREIEKIKNSIKELRTVEITNLKSVILNAAVSYPPAQKPT
jgi:hypothetical protein